MAFQASFFGTVAGECAGDVVVDSALVAGGGDAGAPPCPVLFEAGLGALLVAFDEAEVVLGLVFFGSEWSVEVDEVEHCGLNSSVMRKSGVRVSKNTSPPLCRNGTST